MNVGTIGALSAPPQSIRPTSSEAAEGPGPDQVNDHDSDDLPGGKAPTAAGTGSKVDITA
ncbi:hypothetical protein [Roseibium aggregatum]|uniref:Uncharacterized protein n=1 Tax=Roseibium aggregatum TaxID=187304 RepID=A0A926P2E8_9HYPH|nr:hypothetical protein [Roseibium aggregatum]MBD1548285.1 hypothetical protein [Roseibium aggregatum]